MFLRAWTFQFTFDVKYLMYFRYGDHPFHFSWDRLRFWWLVPGMGHRLKWISQGRGAVWEGSGMVPQEKQPSRLPVAAYHCTSTSPCSMPLTFEGEKEGWGERRQCPRCLIFPTEMDSHPTFERFISNQTNYLLWLHWLHWNYGCREFGPTMTISFLDL